MRPVPWTVESSEGSLLMSYPRRQKHGHGNSTPAVSHSSSRSPGSDGARRAASDPPSPHRGQARENESHHGQRHRGGRSQRQLRDTEDRSPRVDQDVVEGVNRIHGAEHVQQLGERARDGRNCGGFIVPILRCRDLPETHRCAEHRGEPARPPRQTGGGRGQRQREPRGPLCSLWSLT